jgi:hypothetical protein
MVYNGQNTITRMIEIATQDGVDVLRYGIPTDIFIAEWQNEYGMDFPYEVQVEIEREFTKGLPVHTATQYWINLNDWFINFTNEYGEDTSE